MAVQPPARDRGGFSMVELVVALIILTVGLLGMAGTTAFVVRQTTLAEVTSKRAAALQSVLEELRATEYADLSAGADSVGRYHLSWTVTESSRAKEIQIVSEGPGLVRARDSLPVLDRSVPDTFTYKVGRP